MHNGSAYQHTCHILGLLVKMIHQHGDAVEIRRELLTNLKKERLHVASGKLVHGPLSN